MTISRNDDGIYLPTRDENVALFKRSYTLQLPEADTSTGTQPDIDANVTADIASPMEANAAVIFNNTSILTKRGKQVDSALAAIGSARLPKTGALGFVQIDAAAGGVRIQRGQQGTIAGQRYEVTADTRVWNAGDDVPVLGFDTGPLTDQPAGAVLTWVNAPAGLLPQATVVAQHDGTGLTGGRDVESDHDAIQRLIALRSSPAASGNEAEYLDAIYATPGLRIQAAFVYPSILGPGTKGIVFTMAPDYPGASRIPNAAEIAQVLAWLKGQFPADDVILVGALVAQPVNVALQIDWSQAAAGWADATPWPAHASPMVAVDSLAYRPTPTAFRLKNITTAPQAGQSIGFFDPSGLASLDPTDPAAGPPSCFRRKRILTATVVGGDATRYDIVCDTTANASDTGYAPFDGQSCCPWSDSLDALVESVVAYMDGLGAGEQIAAFFDPGIRQRRVPLNPIEWPSAVNNRILSPLFALDVVSSPSVYEPTMPYAASVGSPGAASNIVTLATLVAFP